MITAGVCYSYRKEILEGTHTLADTYKIALYPSTATLSPSTTVYSTTGELATAGGYTQGGVALTNPVTNLSSNVAFLSFDNPSWLNATFAFAGALIYNSSKSNKAVCVLDFGGTFTYDNETVTITIPPFNSSDALIRLTDPD